MPVLEAFLNRRLSTTSLPLPPLLIEPTPEPRRRRKPVPAPKAVKTPAHVALGSGPQVAMTPALGPSGQRR